MADFPRRRTSDGQTIVFIGAPPADETGLEVISLPSPGAETLQEKRDRASLSRKDFLLAAVSAGWITEADAEIAATGTWPSAFDAFLSGLTSAQRIEAKAAWADGRAVRRSSPVLSLIAGHLSVSDAALDAAFGVA